MKDKLAVEALISFKEIISEVYLCSPTLTADGLSYEHQNVFYFMVCSQAWRDLNGSRFNHRLLFLNVACIHVKMK